MKKYKYAIKLTPLLIGEVNAKTEQEARDAIKISLKKIRRSDLKDIQFVGEIKHSMEFEVVEQEL